MKFVFWLLQKGWWVLALGVACSGVTLLITHCMELQSNPPISTPPTVLANLPIGQVETAVVSYPDLQETVTALLAENKEWAALVKKHKMKAVQLTQTVAELETWKKEHEGRGGPEPTPGDPAVLGWSFDDGRLNLRTANVYLSPPRAEYGLTQRFSLVSLIVEDREGTPVSLVTLTEVDEKDKAIGKAILVEGRTEIVVKPVTHWYDHIVAGADLGAGVGSDGLIYAPVRARFGYQATGTFPWRVTAEAWAGAHGMTFGYGGGGVLGVEY